MRTTLQILDDKMEREQDTSHRPHLGASSIGGECERKTRSEEQRLNSSH